MIRKVADADGKAFRSTLAPRARVTRLYLLAAQNPLLFQRELAAVDEGADVRVEQLGDQRRVAIDDRR